MSRVASTALCLLSAASAQAPLLPNGGFETGTTGWAVSIPAVGGDAAAWQAARRFARVVAEPVKEGRAALLLDARGRDGEVDAVSAPIPVQPGHGYRLRSFVKGLTDKGGYKVTLNWLDAAGTHLSYANDWKGQGSPREYTRHGGVFMAPPTAAQAVLILGVQKDSAIVFDDLALDDLGTSEPLDARPRRDGDGTLSMTGPPRVPAHGHGTWQAVYTCGASGLPVGASIVLRRWPVTFDASKAQGSDPAADGHVSVKGPEGTQWSVAAGSCNEVIARLEWPAVAPGARVDITIGDGPGYRVEGHVRESRWIAASDCTGDGDGLDLAQPDAGRFAIVPGEPVEAVVVVPPVAWAAGQAWRPQVELRDAADNPLPASTGVGWTAQLAAQGTKVQPVRGDQNTDLGWTHPGLATVTPTGTGGAKPRPAWQVVSRSPDARLLAEPVPPGKAVAKLLPTGAMIANQSLRLVLPHNPQGMAWGCAALYVDGREVVLLPAVARAAFAGHTYPRNGRVEGALIFATSADATLDGKDAVATLRGQAGGWPFTATYRLRPGTQSVEFSLSLQPRGTAKLISLHAPLVYPATTPEEAAALFPGLEFLNPGEESSADHGVAWSIREREIPHPYKITMPLMAVGWGEQVVGMAWNPLQKWDGAHPVPLAQFAQPDHGEEKPGPFLSLVLPGLSGGFVENVPSPVTGWSRPAGATLRLQCELFALGGTRDVAQAAAWWSRHHPLPPAPPPRPFADELALSARGLLETAWVPKEKGWIPSVGNRAGRSPEVADRLLQAADLTQDAALAEACRRQVGEAFVGTALAGALPFRSDRPESWLAGLRSRASGEMGKQHPDGAWSFADDYSGIGSKAALALPGDVESGTIVNALGPILDYAVATGDPRAVAAGLKGLGRLQRCTVPAGSESWEVPLVNPNLRAAALATRCFLRGWQLTGEEALLDEARRWAWAGSAFIYHWAAPDRKAMPGASISVFGTTFYEHSWFGAAVQWVGLVYADAIDELGRYDTSYDWPKLAKLIIDSASVQQKAPGAKCGHVGLYPDSYHLVKGEDYYEWCLSSVGLLSGLINAAGYPTGPVVHSMSAGENRIGLVGIAWPRAAEWRDGRLIVRLRPAPGYPPQLLLIGLGEPRRVTWNGAELPRGAQPGWRPADREAGLVVSWAPGAAEGELVVEGAAVTGYRAPGLPAALLNGGFEHGALGWGWDDACHLDRVLAHGGGQALLIESPDRAHEGQAFAQPLAVEAGRRYRLTAWVRQVDGDGDYKVTIDWLKPGGAHLRYDNDWQGTDKPAAYSVHGGIFTAPAGAGEARIILGCRGARVLFDDVSLEPLP